MLEDFFLILAVIGSGLAGAWDLKTTEIPDIIPHAMAGIAITLRAIWAFLSGDMQFILVPLAIGIVFLIFGFVMYAGGQWGGGDAKLLAAIGLLIPASPVGLFPFPLVFMVNLFLLGAIYIIIYSFFISVLNPKISSSFLADIRGHSREICLFVAVITVPSLVLLITESWLALPAISLAGILLALLLLWKWLRTVERIGFRKKINTEKLQPGDMLGQDVPELGLCSRIIRGLKKEEVAKIKKTRKVIWIREGVRFGPVFPAAILVTIYFGNLMPLLV